MPTPAARGLLITVRAAEPAEAVTVTVLELVALQLSVTLCPLDPAAEKFSFIRPCPCFASGVQMPWWWPELQPRSPEATSLPGLQ
jgi:hypothetical protein